MKQKFKKLVKNNSFILSIYRSLGKVVLKILKSVLKTDEKLILFVSYGGRYYNDSPKYMYEYMKSDVRYKDYKLFWAFTNPEDHQDIPNRVTIDTLTYYKTALKARCWITNVVVERGLDFKGINTFYFHTTHVALLKYIGYDAKDTSIISKSFKYKYDMSCAQSEYEKELQYGMFGLKDEQVIVCGYPKNDRIANCSKEEQNRLRIQIGIPNGKKAVLYAPTFRDNIDDDAVCPVDFDKWRKILGEDFVILFRAHPVLANKLDLSKYSPFVIDVTPYPDNVELMIAADALISDYSGIFFEFGVQDKPMYAFPYDYDEYIKKWGLYVDVRNEIPGGNLCEEQLLEFIKLGETAKMKSQLAQFKSKYIVEYGSATRKAVDVVYNNIK